MNAFYQKFLSYSKSFTTKINLIALHYYCLYIPLSAYIPMFVYFFSFLNIYRWSFDNRFIPLFYELMLIKFCWLIHERDLILSYRFTSKSVYDITLLKYWLISVVLYSTLIRTAFIAEHGFFHLPHLYNIFLAIITQRHTRFLWGWHYSKICITPLPFSASVVAYQQASNPQCFYQCSLGCVLDNNWRVWMVALCLNISISRQ